MAFGECISVSQWNQAWKQLAAFQSFYECPQENILEFGSLCYMNGD